MKHKITTLLFLFTLGFSFNLITPTDSKAGQYTCAKDANGAIIVKRIGANMFNLTDAADTPADQCSEEPDFYKVLIYKIALCKEDPYTAGGGTLPDYTSCTVLAEDFTKTDADATVIQPGAETSLNISDFTIPTGSYPYATLVVSTKIKVKHTQEFSGTLPANGFRGSGAVLNDGNDSNTFCWSIAKVTTLHNVAHAAGSAYVTAHALGQAVLKPAQTPTSVTMACGPTAGTAAYATEMIDDLKDAGATFVSFENYGDVSDDTGIAGIDMASLLLEDEETIATSTSTAKLISVNYKYAAPIIITEQTSKLDIRIKTSSAISLDFSYSANDSEGAVFFGDKVGANAFTTTVRTKNRRAGRLRDWR